MAEQLWKRLTYSDSQIQPSEVSCMERQIRPFRAILSSDWSECLSPSGPFDFIAFTYPQLEPELKEVFGSYTGNLISLGEACIRIKKILPGRLRGNDGCVSGRSYAVYRGVPELIEWCLGEGVLFNDQHDRDDRLFSTGVRKWPSAADPGALRQPAVPLPDGRRRSAHHSRSARNPDKGKNTPRWPARWASRPNGSS